MYQRFSWIFVFVALSASAVVAEEPPGVKSIIRERPGAQKWALLMGVNKYTFATSLNYCVADVTSLGERLREAGFPKEHVRLMTDDAPRADDKPQRTNLERALDQYLGTLSEDGQRVVSEGLVGPGDLVVVAFSGHGLHLDGESYFCPADTDLERRESLVSLERVYRRLEACRASFKLLVVDACRNDPRLPGQKSAVRAPDAKALASSFETPPKGILVLTSCAPGQVSSEDEKLGHGVFMNYVLSGLAGAADREKGDRNGRVSLLELYRFADEKTRAYVAEARKPAQSPRLRGEIEGDWEFGVIAPQLPPEITNSLGMKFRLIEPGEFSMGSPANETDRDDDEAQHTVRIAAPYYLAAYETTQIEFDSLMKANPSHFSPTGAGQTQIRHLAPGKLPVESVTWTQANKFCAMLSELPAEAKQGRMYRLPREAEWEYACRAGSTTPFSFGNRCDGTEANCDGTAPYGGAAAGRYFQTTAPVGSYKANAWGLFDMHGNVWEWCADSYRPEYEPFPDPASAEAPKGRVMRGGSWYNSAADCRSAKRGRADPKSTSKFTGFRVLCEVEPGKP